MDRPGLEAQVLCQGAPADTPVRGLCGGSCQGAVARAGRILGNWQGPGGHYKSPGWNPHSGPLSFLLLQAGLFLLHVQRQHSEASQLLPDPWPTVQGILLLPQVWSIMDCMVRAFRLRYQCEVSLLLPKLTPVCYQRNQSVG